LRNAIDDSFFPWTATVTPNENSVAAIPAGGDGIVGRDGRAAGGSMRQMAEQQFDEDLKVLSHLRGYPEDLRHYSNLIKQSHPRGMSALR
jgi:hypothetical protein